MNIYQDILTAKKNNKKLLAVLIDPEKIALQHLPDFFRKVHESKVTHVFVGGSTDVNNQIENTVIAVKKNSHLPVLLFPGNAQQITKKADGILFLSLLSGRNPEYLIAQQIQAVPFLQNTSLEIIPTGYLLIDGGNETAVAKVSKTQPIAQSDIKLIKNTALVGEYLGKKLIYLEAGSGAKIAVNQKIINEVSSNITIPLIVGGGIRTKKQLDLAYEAGADLIVIGTAFENNETFFQELKN